MKYIYGSELTKENQELVKRMYVHRHTGDHPAKWAGKRSVFFVTDEQWLRHTQFAVTNKGKLDARVRHCLTDLPNKKGLLK